ncbi:AAA family ATPase [Candidatus Poriferisodalis sp.]|uniref:AAA family ATPase n=1 Tax=Candidatus Poriferisodalis sp. TaxID=3101277 RepID=UPI003B522550
MTRSLSIPTGQGQSVDISLDSENNALFVLGANGSGKSALLHWLYGEHQRKHPDGSYAVRLIKAHRMTSLGTNRVDVSASAFETQLQQAHQDDSAAYGRYWDRRVPNRAQSIIYELLREEVGQLARIGRKARNARVGRTDFAAVEQAVDQSTSPIEVINGLFQSAGLEIQVEIPESDPDALVARRRNSDTPYGIEQLSDGERSALLLAAQILSAPAGTLFLIDEPERHLHRSIAGPLLSGIFAARRDCEFVVATHEISLPHDCQEAHVLLLRGWEPQGNGPQTWDADLVAPDADIDDDIKLDIWGARRHLVYVEGKPHSLDKRVYETLFPQATFVARDGWQQVVAAVSAAHASRDLHWLQVHGLIDRDRHEDDTLDEGARQVVCMLGCYAIESIYYCAEAQHSVGVALARDAGERIEDRLAAAREAVLAEAHTLARIEHVDPERLRCDIESEAADAIIANYPISKSVIPDRIAQSLGFRGRKAYEQAVRIALRGDEALRGHVAAMCAELGDALGQADQESQSDAA